MNKLLLERVTKWQDATFGQATPLSKLAHLRKELVELEVEIGSDLSFGAEEEYADCFLLLYGSAIKYGMTWDTINLAISRKMDKNEKRKWGKPDAEGVVEHTEEGTNDIP